MCGCLSHTPYWGPGLQPKHVSWLGIEPVTLWFAGRCSIHWATPTRAICFKYIWMHGLLCWRDILNYHVFAWQVVTSKHIVHTPTQSSSSSIKVHKSCHSFQILDYNLIYLDYFGSGLSFLHRAKHKLSISLRELSLWKFFCKHWIPGSVSYEEEDKSTPLNLDDTAKMVSKL